MQPVSVKLLLIAKQNLRSISLYGGFALVLLWTVLRHITNGINFDVVGQIGVASQWAHGVHSGVQLGPTNYVLKMPLYSLVNAFSFLSPMNRLLLLAAICNLATFACIFIFSEKILQLQGVKNRAWLYVALLWLASIFGAVFWADYANSRNLEIAATVGLVYLTLQYLSATRLKTLALLVIAGSLVFFADPLQVYVYGAGVGLFVIFRNVVGFTRRRSKHLTATASDARLLGALLIAYAGSKLLTTLSVDLLKINFLQVPGSGQTLSLATLLQTLQGTLTSLFKIFDANFFKIPVGPNSLRALLNTVVLGAIIVLLIKFIRSNATNKLAGQVLLCIALANLLIYSLSGQALHPETQRYIVMVPIVLIVLVGLYGPRLYAKNKVRPLTTWMTLIFVSSLLLLGGLAISVPSRHSKDGHIYQTLAYLNANKTVYALGSREAGVTTTYFAEGKQVVLPLACSDHRLQATNLFFDNGAFEGFRGYTGEVPILLQMNEIKFGNYHCRKSDIVIQFGLPIREDIIPGVGTALIYPGSQIQINN